MRGPNKTWWHPPKSWSPFPSSDSTVVRETFVVACFYMSSSEKDLVLVWGHAQMFPLGGMPDPLVVWAQEGAGCGGAYSRDLRVLAQMWDCPGCHTLGLALWSFLSCFSCP